MNKLLLALMVPTFITAQEFVDPSAFDFKTAKGTVVIEFWAEWNAGNQVEFFTLVKRL